VDASKFPDEVALMLLGSRCSDYSYQLRLTLYDPKSGFLNDVRETTCDDGDVEANRPEQSSLIDRDSSSACQVVTHKPPEDRSKLHEYHKSSRKGGCKIEPGQSLPCGLGLEHDCEIWLRLSDKDVQRWTRATEALRQEPDKYKPGQRIELLRDQLQKRSENFQDRPFNVKEAQEVLLGTMSDDPLFWLMLIALPMVYGSVHLTAWNFDFPSRVEHIMWRVACIIIAGGIPGSCMAVGIIIALASVGYSILRKGWIKKLFYKVEDWLAVGYHIFGKGWIKKLIHKVAELLRTLFALFILGLAALYFGARLFVIVESFISIRRLPLGVFVTVHWANYIPHL
jgi:hypothetical protein